VACLQIEFVEKPEIEAEALALLRKSVGWDGHVDQVSQTIGCSYFWAGCFTAGQLVGYVEAISDGIDDAYIRNLIVHPEYQRRGLGLKLLGLATERIKAAGIKMANVLFEPQLAPFYRKAGFTIIAGGLINNHESQD
jgi:ribosomal protein S18 acetylase RimI-like enzyme